MAVASTVTVNITAETAKFENGLKKAKNASKGFAGAVSKAMKGAAVATGLLGVALVALTRASFVLVDQQRKVARTLGTTQKIYAGLSLAAGISGIAVKSFEKALKKQLKAVVDANDGLLTQKKAFDRLGLAASDLIRLPVEEQFKKITQALGEVENASLKVGIASDIFGAKNSDLINILDLGAEGLDHYIKKVEELGVAMTDKQTKNIEDANDAILVMKTAFTGLGNQIAARVSPIVKTFAERIEKMTSRVTNAIPKWTAWAAAIFGVERALDSLTIRDLDAELKQINTDMGKLVDERDDIIDALRDPALVGEFGAAFQIEIDDLNAELLLLTERYTAAAEARAKLAAKGEVQTPDAIGSGEGLIGDLDANAFQRDFDSAIRATATPLEAFKAKLNAIRASLKDNPLWTDQLAERQAGAAVDAYLEQLKRIDVANTELIDKQKADFEAAAAAVATPTEKLQAAINEIRKNLESNPFWTPEIARRQAQEAVDAYLEELKRIEEKNAELMENMTEFQRQAFANMQDILSEFLFDPWDEGLDGMFKSFVDMLRKMVAQILATKILEFLFGLLGGGTASVAAGAGSGGGGGNALNFGTAAAIGGTRAGGTPLVVGEHGAELFSPGASGSIRPLGSISIEQNNSFGGGGGIDAAILIPILEENNRKLKGELLDEIDRGVV